MVKYKTIRIDGKELKVNIIETTKEQAKGLMFKINPKPALFQNVSKIFDCMSMFFVFRKIKIIFLDENKRILKQAKLYPFISLSMIPRGMKYTIEIPLYGDYIQFDYEIQTIEY